MKKKTLQSAANKIFRHLSKMTEQSICFRPHWGNVCAYRGEFGNKCAIGCLILNRLYDPIMDNSLEAVGTKLKYSPLVISALRRSGWPTDARAIDFYVDAQEVHDSFFERRIEKFIELAERYGLTVPKIEDKNAN